MNRKSIFGINDKIWKNKINEYFVNNLFRYKGITRYVIDYYRDCVLPSLVFMYHKSEYKKVFLNFIENENHIKIIHPQIIQLLSDHFSFIENIISAVEKNFNNIKNIDIVGDIHGIYKTKLLITKNNGQKFVLTGVDFSSDNTIIDIYEKIFKQESFYKYKEFGEFYIREFIPYKNNFKKRQDIELFYSKLGELLGFFYGIRAIDLHYENMLISDNMPYIFDFECVFCPELAGEDYSFSTAGIIQNDDGEDFSMLSGGRADRRSLLTPILTSIDKNPKIIRNTRSKKKMLHIPISNGETIKPYVFYEIFFNNLNTSLIKIARNKKEIINLISHNTIYNRILIRPTRVYYALIKDFIMDLSISKDYIDMEKFLWNKLNMLPVMPNISDKEKIIKSEIRNLMKGLIPSFYSEIHKTTIYDSEGNNVGSLNDSCISIMIKYIKNKIKLYV